MDASKVTQEPPSIDEPVIYIFCSNKKNTWIRNCELACEFLTGMFLGKLTSSKLKQKLSNVMFSDESNPALKSIHQDLLKRRLLVRKTIKTKDTEGRLLYTKTMLSIVNGRKPRKLVCPPTDSGKPCPLCFSNGANHHKKFLPFRYYRPDTPTQSNDYDCGTYTLYAIRMWIQQEALVKSSLHEDSTRLWTPVDIYKYRYECRRYLDRIGGRPDREPVNEFGTAEENCYLSCQKKSYDLFRMVGNNHDPLDAIEKICNSEIKENKSADKICLKEKDSKDTSEEAMKALSVAEVCESIENEKTAREEEQDAADNMETYAIPEPSSKTELLVKDIVEEKKDDYRNAATPEDSINDASEAKIIKCTPDQENEQNEIMNEDKNVEDDESSDSIPIEADKNEETDDEISQNEALSKEDLPEKENADDLIPIYSPEDISSRFVQLMIHDEPEDIEDEDSSMIAEVKNVFNGVFREEKQLKEAIDPGPNISSEEKVVKIAIKPGVEVDENSKITPLNLEDALENCNQAVIDEKIASLDESSMEEELSVDDSDFSENIVSACTIVRKTWAM